jgi:hypothetical protein
MEEHFKKLRENYPKAAKIHLILDRGSYNIGKIIDDNNLKWLLLALCVLTVLIRLSVYNRLGILDKFYVR